MKTALKIILIIGVFWINILQILSFKNLADSIPITPYFIVLFSSIISVILLTATYFMTEMYAIIYHKIKGTHRINKKMLHAYFPFIGFLNALYVVILIFTAKPTPAYLQPILPNISIPLTFILSYIIIQRNIKLKYFIGDFVSATIVFVGVIISVIPIIINNNDNNNNIIWPIIFTIGVIPGVLSNIVLEKLTEKQTDINYLHLNMWIAVYQTIIIIIFHGINLLIPSDIKNITDLMNQLNQGLKCTFWIDIDDKTNCKIVSLWLFVLILTTLLKNIVVSIILSFTTSLFINLLYVLSTPLTEIIFILAGSSSFTIFPFLSMPIIFVGIIINIVVDYYRSKNKSDNACEQTHLLQIVNKN